MALDMKTGYRNYLKEKGFKDEEITYDNGNILAKGKYFGSATPEADGSTYDPRSVLDRAYGNYQRQQNTDEMGAMRNQLKERINKPATPFSYTTADINNDPVYQAQMKQAEQSAALAQGNATARLRAGGQGRSSYSEGVAQLAAQRELGTVTANLLPQLSQQAYQRHLGQQQQENQQTNMQMALMEYLNRSNQQGIDNDYRDQVFADKQKNDRIQQQQWGVNTYGYGDAKNDYGVFMDQYKGAVPLAIQQLMGSINGQRTLQGQQVDDSLLTSSLQRALSESGVTGMYKDKPTMQKEAQDFGQWRDREQLDISRINAANSGISSGLSKQRYNDETTARQLAGQIMNELGQADNEEEIMEFLKANSAYITSQLGLDGYKAIEAQALSPYREQAKSNAASAKQTQDQERELTNKAIDLAKGDYRWKAATPSMQRQLIEEAKQMLRSMQ